MFNAIENGEKKVVVLAELNKLGSLDLSRLSIEDSVFFEGDSSCGINNRELLKLMLFKLDKLRPENQYNQEGLESVMNKMAVMDLWGLTLSEASSWDSSSSRSDYFYSYLAKRTLGDALSLKAVLDGDITIFHLAYHIQASDLIELFASKSCDPKLFWRLFEKVSFLLACDFFSQLRPSVLLGKLYDKDKMFKAELTKLKPPVLNMILQKMVMKLSPESVTSDVYRLMESVFFDCKNFSSLIERPKLKALTLYDIWDSLRSIDRKNRSSYLSKVVTWSKLKSLIKSQANCSEILECLDFAGYFDFFMKGVDKRFVSKDLLYRLSYDSDFVFKANQKHSEEIESFLSRFGGDLSFKDMVMIFGRFIFYTRAGHAFVGGYDVKNLSENELFSFDSFSAHYQKMTITFDIPGYTVHPGLAQMKCLGISRTDEGFTAYIVTLWRERPEELTKHIRDAGGLVKLFGDGRLVNYRSTRMKGFQFDLDITSCFLMPFLRALSELGILKPLIRSKADVKFLADILKNESKKFLKIKLLSKYCWYNSHDPVRLDDDGTYSSVYDYESFFSDFKKPYKYKYADEFKDELLGRSFVKRLPAEVKIKPPRAKSPQRIYPKKIEPERYEPVMPLMHNVEDSQLPAPISPVKQFVGVGGGPTCTTSSTGVWRNELSVQDGPSAVKRFFRLNETLYSMIKSDLYLGADSGVNLSEPVASSVLGRLLVGLGISRAHSSKIKEHGRVISNYANDFINPLGRRLTDQAKLFLKTHLLMLVQLIKFRGVAGKEGEKSRRDLFNRFVCAFSERDLETFEITPGAIAYRTCLSDNSERIVEFLEKCSERNISTEKELAGYPDASALYEKLLENPAAIKGCNLDAIFGVLKTSQGSVPGASAYSVVPGASVSSFPAATSAMVERNNRSFFAPSASVAPNKLDSASINIELKQCIIKLFDGYCQRSWLHPNKSHVVVVKSQLEQLKSGDILTHDRLKTWLIDLMCEVKGSCKSQPQVSSPGFDLFRKKPKVYNEKGTFARLFAEAINLIEASSVPEVLRKT